ncbi:MAG: cupin domain-containing protein, partial [Gorillibacterium sp.]|nr:cupin domain-containing protein [Gorillibacterium sp.]
MNTVLQAPDLTLAADSNRVLNYKRDPHNYITQLFGKQLPAIQNGFFNVHMSKGIIVQPHWHTNVTEMIFVITGEIITSVCNPFTQRLLTYR